MYKNNAQNTFKIETPKMALLGSAIINASFPNTHHHMDFDVLWKKKNT